MINDMSSEVEQSVGKAMYADKGDYKLQYILCQ